MNERQQAASGMMATDVEECRVYEPKIQPGYSAWAVPWRSPNGQVYLAFLEKRRAENPAWQAVPLEFFEAMGLPINYHITFCNGAKNIVGESVVLRSDDEGRTWREVGRSVSRVMNLFSWTSLDDDVIMRAVCDDYVAFDPDKPSNLWVEVSDDQGNIWKQRSVIAENIHTAAYRLKRLHDGVLVLAAPYTEGFGPGRPRPWRQVKRTGVVDELLCGVFISRDNGYTWSDPLILFPGNWAPEPDFVELPSGDLLFFNSIVQSPAYAARQFVHRQGYRFLPGPMYKVADGKVPETVTLTGTGLLVGTSRGRDYVCSNDLGASWYQIDGMPKSKYQPYIMQMRDGTFLNAWHHGGDNYFGQIDQYIGTHRFRLQGHLPVATQLTIERDRSCDDEIYLNTFTVILTAEGKPLAGKTIQFAFNMRYTEDFERSSDPRVSGTRSSVVTDEHGLATLDLRVPMDAVENIHQHYRVVAWYAPEKVACDFAPTCSDIYQAYPITMTREQLASGCI